MAAQALLHDEKGLAGKAVDEFPSLFRSNDRRVNLNIARDWWRKRPAENDDETADSKPLKYARSGAGNRHQFLIKSARGREPKLGEHSSWLYPTLLTEFERLRKAGVKMSTRLLQVVAIALIEESQHPIFNKAFCFNDREFRGLVTPRRLQDFTDRFNIVYRRLKLFDDKLMDPNLQFNMDESHFVIDLDDGKTLDFRGSKHVKYRSIVSDAVAMAQPRSQWVMVCQWLCGLRTVGGLQAAPSHHAVNIPGEMCPYQPKLTVV
ncbi:hypothetical protein PC113_g15166 [Phytophthora cactorum]|uniref:Uncharacterized protein n=1 Tax=Phytophthora cactorum TaxID=29920 RepID=A0A8T0YUV5_9STRA|nr:hypothetical protein PC113_g15166 [Phytophthora cactorum]